MTCAAVASQTNPSPNNNRMTSQQQQDNSEGQRGDGHPRPARQQPDVVGPNNSPKGCAMQRLVGHQRKPVGERSCARRMSEQSWCCTNVAKEYEHASVVPVTSSTASYSGLPVHRGRAVVQLVFIGAEPREAFWGRVQGGNTAARDRHDVVSASVLDHLRRRRIQHSLALDAEWLPGEPYRNAIRCGSSQRTAF